MRSPKATRRKIKSEWRRQGLQTPASHIVTTLTNQGLDVNLEAVRAVQIELLDSLISASRPNSRTAPPPKRPQKIPQQRRR